MRVEWGLERKVISKLTVMMIIESKLDKNGSRLIVLAKCMSAVMATLISAKECRQPLEAGKGEETVPPLQPPEKNTALLTP